MTEQPSKIIDRQAWMQLYEELYPDEVDAVFMVCGYKVSPTGKLSRRYTVVQLDRRTRAVLEAQAKSHGRSLEAEASRVLAAELRRLARVQSGELEHAAHDGE